MSMVAVYLVPCCKREISFGRFIPPEGSRPPEMTCPLCGTRVKLDRNMGELHDEKIYNVKHPMKYVLPLKEEIQEVKREKEEELLW